MHVYGCHVVSRLDASGFEGFLATVTKVEHNGAAIPEADRKTVGDFKLLKNAMIYARDWSDPANPPPMPVEVDPSVKVEEQKSPANDGETPELTPDKQSNQQHD